MKIPVWIQDPLDVEPSDFGDKIKESLTELQSDTRVQAELIQYKMDFLIQTDVR